MRVGATGPLDTAILKAGQHYFDLIPGQVREPMVGSLLSTLQDLSKHVGDDSFRAKISDQALQFQVQSTKSSLDSHMAEFPVDPSLQKCQKLGVLVLTPENLESVDPACVRRLFDVAIAFMVEETQSWILKGGEYEDLWAVHVSALLKGLCKTSDDRMWCSAVGVVADLQRSTQQLSAQTAARDCARLVQVVKKQLGGDGLKFEEEKSTRQAEKWTGYVLVHMMKKVNDLLAPLVVSDVQALADKAVVQVGKLKEVCRGGPSGKHWAENRKPEVDIVQHAQNAFVNLKGLTNQIEKANLDAKEAPHQISDNSMI